MATPKPRPEPTTIMTPEEQLRAERSKADAQTEELKRWETTPINKLLGDPRDYQGLLGMVSALLLLTMACLLLTWMDNRLDRVEDRLKDLETNRQLEKP